MPRRLQPTLIIALATIVVQTRATCYGSGESWGSQAETAATTACSSYLNGGYGPQSTVSGEKSVCINADGKKNEFFVWHIEEGERTLGVAECLDGLLKEVNGCSRGGDTSYTNWRYKADPNAGTC
ncbi:hypothetical protein F4778DRAFT_768541 [Xylariomycetidae sp. FL2044]|nr:hypothetical protein F4778DRAFT_788783 [Xylariomycetidae sp. FL2044]KAH9908755.1 hypothetical protein F4778DRAFT_768541 [Xylariomycetidae sp. FL2044]